MKIKQEILVSIRFGLTESLQIPLLNQQSEEIFDDKKFSYGTVLSSLFQGFTYRYEKPNKGDSKLSLANGVDLTIMYFRDESRVSNLIKFSRNSIEKHIIKLNDEGLVSKHIIRNKNSNKDLFVAEITYNGEYINIRYEEVLEKRTYFCKFIQCNNQLICIESVCDNISIVTVVDNKTGETLNKIKRVNDIITETIDVEKDGIIKKKDGKIYIYTLSEDGIQTIDIYNELEYNPMNLSSPEKVININANNLTTKIHDFMSNTITTYILPFIKERGATKIKTVIDMTSKDVLSKNIFYYSGFEYRPQYEYSLIDKNNNEYIENFHNYYHKKGQHMINEYKYIDGELVNQTVYMFDYKETNFIPANAYHISTRKMIIKNGDTKSAYVDKMDKKENKSYHSKYEDHNYYLVDEIDEDITIMDLEFFK